MLKMRKLTPREIKDIVQGYTESMWYFKIET